ncbi:MAG: hypothetical protein ACR2FQ_00680 [Pseudonocardiaceae bacterium]
MTGLVLAAKGVAACDGFAPAADATENPATGGVDVLAAAPHPGPRPHELLAATPQLHPSGS